MAAHARRIPLHSAINLRDLGGYPTIDGRVTPFGRFFRSDNMYGLSQEDMELLVKQGVRTIIDLRTPGEVEKEPNSFADHPQVAVKYCSLLGADISGFVGPLADGFVRSLGENYSNMIRRDRAYYVELFQLIAENVDRGAVLFHCTAGKDRTGVTAALLLQLAGVYDVDIVADYHLTSVYLKTKMEKFLAEHPESPAELQSAKEASMVAFLESLRQEFGDAYGYLRSIGLPKEVIDAAWGESLTELL